MGKERERRKQTTVGTSDRQDLNAIPNKTKQTTLQLQEDTTTNKQTNNIKNVQKSNGVKHAAGSKQQTTTTNKQMNNSGKEHNKRMAMVQRRWRAKHSRESHSR
eukprot:EC800128.1.p2 GENE.EC800128.1~~EC800128.1.p2  ORF type:complete len:104 (-),score=18.73 EC800128.1:348-659(-)